MIVLVSCVSLKAPAARPARELYVSDWFRKARAFAEAQGCPWAILSALHGVLTPGQVVDPYSLSLHELGAAGRRAWAARTLEQLEQLVPASGPVVFLAGRLYRDGLAPHFGERARAPMAGLGIGEQLAWLKRAVPNNRD